MPYEDFAATLSIPVGSVMPPLARARATLRRSMASESDPVTPLKIVR
jgi:DNA-directed RNA polymerase specialized sigma24 family protein